jgi:hypothetical protein
MRLSELLLELREINVDIVEHWHHDGVRGITLGTNEHNSPRAEYQYPIATSSMDPDLTAEEVHAIRRCFGIYES